MPKASHKTDRNFDTLIDQFEKRVYDTVKGEWRLKLLKEDLDTIRNTPQKLPGLAEKDAAAGLNALSIWDAGCGFAQISQWFAEAGVRAITVSSLAMARYFANHGWDDITIALLLNPLQWPDLQSLALELAQRGGHLGVVVDSPEAASLVARLHTFRCRFGSKWTPVLAAPGYPGKTIPC